MVAVREQCCPLLFVEPFEPLFFLADLTFVVPDQSEVSADDQIVFFSHLCGNSILQQFPYIDITVCITCQINHVQFTGTLPIFVWNQGV